MKFTSNKVKRYDIMTKCLLVESAKHDCVVLSNHLSAGQIR